ncbi:MAG: hypothetical protein IJO16_03055, partial [Clostridia bacterium]|nr:hypothetical protein [Clostridia bacterium]
MYKQMLFGFQSPIVAGIIETFAFLLYTSFIEFAWGTEYGGFLYYVGITVVFILISLYIFIGAITKYEYAVLYKELIMRKYIRGNIIRIYSINLIHSNCI